MPLRFGTDGVRGVAGSELTPELVTALARSAARELSKPGATWVVGRDTRRSGPMLEAALSAGLAAEGADVRTVGVLPTPGVAAFAAARGSPAAVISASHNPFADNGIKFFDSAGRKLTDEMEERVEASLANVRALEPSGLAGHGIGVVEAEPGAVAWYRRRVLDGLEGRRLDGLHVAVDCANGAACVAAVEVLEAAGAEVVAVLGNEPDGSNINQGCGSTEPLPLASAVVAAGADAGLAFDGDADRVIAVDGRGNLVDGDRLLAIFATDLRRRGRLAGNTVVVTVMTNLGFHHTMTKEGITVHQTQVGDRNVLGGLEQTRASLGGEQSGHIIFSDMATTGDGLLSGLMLLDVVRRTGCSLGELAEKAMRRFPQVLRNVKVSDRDGLDSASAVWDAVKAVEVALADRGRVLLRPSGTEQLVRVMVEAPTDTEASVAVDRICEVVAAELG